MSTERPQAVQMKAADISDRRVIDLAAAWHANPAQPGVFAALVADGVPVKLARHKIQRLCDRGLLEYGTTVDYAWPTHGR